MERKLETKDMAAIGMLTALMAVLSQLSIPLPTGVPITLQTFAVPLCGYVLGWKRGTASTALYLLLGAAGVPVFAGLRGGLSSIFGMAGGFLVGFIFLALFAGVGIQQKSRAAALSIGAVGILMDHMAGIAWYAYVSGNTMGQAFFTVSLPYLAKDMISLALAYGAALAIRQRLAAVDVGFTQK